MCVSKSHLLKTKSPGSASGQEVQNNGTGLRRAENHLYLSAAFNLEGSLISPLEFLSAASAFSVTEPNSSE